MRSSTWLRYLRRLGRNSGLEHSFTQYCARRGLVNAVNSKWILLLSSSSPFTVLMLMPGITADKAPSSVRDQIFDHQSDTVRYYLDWEVRFNTQATFLGRPSDEAVQKLARLMTLTVDPNAPTKLTAELSDKLANSKRVVHLSHKSKASLRNSRRNIDPFGLHLRTIRGSRQRNRWMPPCTVRRPTVATECSKKPGSDIFETPTRLHSKLSLLTRLPQHSTKRQARGIPAI